MFSGVKKLGKVKAKCIVLVNYTKRYNGAHRMYIFGLWGLTYFSNKLIYL
jgi:hypothetical protein